MEKSNEPSALTTETNPSWKALNQACCEEVAIFQKLVDETNKQANVLRNKFGLTVRFIPYKRMDIEHIPQELMISIVTNVTPIKKEPT